jgi:hypothetical protein
MLWPTAPGATSAASGTRWRHSRRVQQWHGPRRQSHLRRDGCLRAGPKSTTGDFNGDGKSDIIWQHDNGAAALWLMDGTNATFVGAIGPFNPGPSWEIKGTGDFNGDSEADILWQLWDRPGTHGLHRILRRVEYGPHL